MEHTGNEYIQYWPSDVIDANALRVGPEGVLMTLVSNIVWDHSILLVGSAG